MSEPTKCTVCGRIRDGGRLPCQQLLPKAGHGLLGADLSCWERFALTSDHCQLVANALAVAGVKSVANHFGLKVATVKAIRDSGYEPNLTAERVGDTELQSHDGLPKEEFLGWYSLWQSVPDGLTFQEFLMKWCNVSIHVAGKADCNCIHCKNVRHA